MVGEDSHNGKLNTLENLIIPKNKSSSSLFADVQSATRVRFSIDSARSDMENLVKSPILPEHEHGSKNNGLRRIRRQPPSRAPTLPPSPELSFTSPSRSSSLSMNFPHSRTFPASGPGSPTLASFGEDLTRFPSESLHSFSFAHQTEDALHERQEILRRSIELVGDKMGWASQDPRVLNAHAKVTGDAEMQSIVELLSKANILGKDSDDIRGLGILGPLTGPAHLVGENVFEKEFDATHSPASEDGVSPGLSMPATLDSESRTTSSQSKLSSQSVKDTASSPRLEASDPTVGKSLDDSSIPSTRIVLPPPRPGGLKRSTTDVGSLYLRSKLEIALAKPYLAKSAAEDSHFLAPPVHTKMSRPDSQIGPDVIAPTGFSKHRWTPAAQCLFTSEAHSPYTMQSANDLACLVFGVRKDQIKKLGMLELIRNDRRDWLSERLCAAGSEADVKNKIPPLKPSRKSPSPSTSLAMGGGLTAMLLSRPPSRMISKVNKRAQTDDGSGSSLINQGDKKISPHHQSSGSRGVLLCGDVVPIQKQNGHVSAASLWVKEKKGGLIWVMEEIVEDVATLTLDASGKVLSATGATHIVCGDEPVDRKEIRKILPKAPMRGTPRTVDYETMRKIQHYTVKNTNGYNLPVSLSVVASLGEVAISTFPHIAGIMVLSSTTLEITSSNSVFSAALFGHKKPDGLHITELIPQFRKLLDFLIYEEDVDLVDGIVVPEQSFRRARAMLAIREGSKDPAALFLRHLGIEAKHRDGASLNIDVQMRVVRSEKVAASSEAVIQETEEDENSAHQEVAVSEVVYALWITYSRNLHSLASNGLTASPLMSRPPSPPSQPSPGQSVTIMSPAILRGESPHPSLDSETFVSEQLKEAAMEPVSDKMPTTVSIKKDPPESEEDEPRKKKTIADFQLLEDMGQGAYGQVKLARQKNPPGQKVVLKYVTKKRILVDTWTRDRKLGTVPLEIHVMNYLRKDGLRHPNIVEMTDFFEDDTNYYIEMVPHGLPGMDLFDYIEMRTTMEEAECRNIFRQVVAALHHLHTKAQIVHRDIKDENIVLDGDNNVKLIDFGSASYVKSGPFDVFVGTIDYAAPEVLQGRSYGGKEQDVWALGILLYTIIYKENPFYNVDEILDRELRVPWVMSNDSIELVRGMLNRDVEQRMTIEDVVKHPWTVGEDGWKV